MRNMFISGAAAVLILTGCSQQGTGPGVETESSANSSSGDRTVQTADQRYPTSETRPIPGVEATANGKSKQLSFLNRIRDADPQFKTIDRAMMNDSNELGIVLDRNVNMDDIPALMRSLIKQMAAEFPNEDLTVLAYAPANPPMLIGTGRLNAQTRDMTYTPAQPSNNRN